MVTRDLVKSQIDHLQEQYLNIIYRILLAFMPTPFKSTVSTQESTEEESWDEFIQNTYGMFRDDPLERPSQGTFEVRETLKQSTYNSLQPVSHLRL